EYGLRRLPSYIAQMIQREVPGNPKHPGAALHRSIRPRWRTGDAEEHLLRQVAGGLGMTDHAAQIPEDPVPMFEKERRAVRHRETLTLKNPAPIESSRA